MQILSLIERDIRSIAWGIQSAEKISAILQTVRRNGEPASGLSSGGGQALNHGTPFPESAWP